MLLPTYFMTARQMAFDTQAQRPNRANF